MEHDIRVSWSAAETLDLLRGGTSEEELDGDDLAELVQRGLVATNDDGTIVPSGGWEPILHPTATIAVDRLDAGEEAISDVFFLDADRAIRQQRLNDADVSFVEHPLENVLVDTAALAGLTVAEATGAGNREAEHVDPTGEMDFDDTFLLRPTTLEEILTGQPPAIDDAPPDFVASMRTGIPSYGQIRCMRRIDGVIHLDEVSWLEFADGTVWALEPPTSALSDLTEDGIEEESDSKADELEELLVIPTNRSMLTVLFLGAFFEMEELSEAIPDEQLSTPDLADIPEDADLDQ